MATSNSASPLQHRLRRLGLLDSADSRALAALLQRRRRHESGTLLQGEQSRYELTRFVLSGWLLRYQILPDGTRQIINFVLPGDGIGLFGAVFAHCDSAVEVMVDVELAEVPCDELLRIFQQSPRLAAALCWLGGLQEGIADQQIVRVGGMNAELRIAHLLLELCSRLSAVGCAADVSSRLPLTQVLVAEALGMTHIHANRCFRRLRQRGLIVVANGEVLINSASELAEFCGFDSNYITTNHVPNLIRRRL